MPAATAEPETTVPSTPDDLAAGYRPIPDPIRTQWEHGLRHLGVPGGSLVVFDADGVRYAGGAGIANITTGTPATAATRYHLYSTTKIYTAALIDLLVDEGRLSLDDPIGDHIPSAAGLVGVTLRMLLDHSARIPDTFWAMVGVHDAGQEPPDTTTLLTRYRLRLGKPPGVSGAYRNVHYALLGEVIRRVTGRPYVEYARERLLQPLGTSADFVLRDADRPTYSPGYLAVSNPLGWLVYLLAPTTARVLIGKRVRGYRELRPFQMDNAAIGGLIGSVLDQVPMGRIQLNGGRLGDQQILPESVVTRMQMLSSTGSTGIVAALGTAHGWKHGQTPVTPGRPFLCHEGGGPGYTVEFRLYPALGIGMALVANRSRLAAYHHHHAVCEAIAAHEAKTAG